MGVMEILLIAIIIGSVVGGLVGLLLTDWIDS